jgi:hypothetical protein
LENVCQKKKKKKASPVRAPFAYPDDAVNHWPEPLNFASCDGVHHDTGMRDGCAWTPERAAQDTSASLTVAPCVDEDST